MLFHVGPFTYRACLVRGHARRDGQPCLGLCDHERGLLLISDRLGREERFQVLCHELWHAWRYRFGSAGLPGPGDGASAATAVTADGASDSAHEESLADLAGIAMTQLAADLFGGVPPLDAGLGYLDEAPLTPSEAYLAAPESGARSGTGEARSVAVPSASDEGAADAPAPPSSPTYWVRVFEPPGGAARASRGG